MTELEIPSLNGDLMTLNLEPGKPVFVVGPNGSGKSALLTHLAPQRSPEEVVRISAHRRLWMDHSTIDLIPSSRRQEGGQIKREDREPQARWHDQRGHARVRVLLFDLIAEEHRRAKAITKRVDEGDLDDADKLSKQESAPLERLNRLLVAGKMQVQVTSSADEELLVHSADTPETYGIAEMSDGERAAMLLITQVLVAKSGQLFLIDEPERHLHRAIAVPLLAALMKERPDCLWVISTHELSLPIAFPASRSLLLRGTRWENHKPVGWSIDVLESGDIPTEDLRRDILGSRQTIVFVEGSLGGIDHQLYEALINDNEVTVIPKGGWLNVQRAVIGLQDTANLHHVRAFGLIDGDGRPDDDLIQLKADNVFVLPCWSIESLLYSEEVRGSVAHAHADTTGQDPDVIISEMKSNLLEAFSQQETRRHLIDARTHRAVVRKIRKQIPSAKGLESHIDSTLCISVPIPRDDEEQMYDQLIKTENLSELIARYPVKESPVLGAVCNALGWQDGRQYQQAAAKQIRKHVSLREHLQKQLGGLTAAIAEGYPSPPGQPD